MVGETIFPYRFLEVLGWGALGRGTPAPRPPSGDQISLLRSGPRPGRTRTFPARGALRFGAKPPKHLHGLRPRRARRPALPRDGGARRPDAAGTDCRTSLAD